MPSISFRSCPRAGRWSPSPAPAGSARRDCGRRPRTPGWPACCAKPWPPPQPRPEQPLLDETDEDSDFGDFHEQRWDAIVTVAYAVAAAAAIDDETTLLARATSAARAEIRMLKALYSERTGGFTGVLDDPGVARELQWQRDDLTDLLAGAPVDAIRSRAATAATLLRTGITTGDWSGRPSGLDETPLL
ncbi:hypothetical protein AB0J83_25205 [Actinoplanes sp. NPDC049596]|uniref:hypothetical protein n=1 Tax=Actinoplanes sp. NPDC049596 TaxID=3154625 RepID=UPI00341DCB3B